MTRKKQSASERLLTEVELELMRIIWNHDGVTVREVVDALPPNRELAYTSVATIMKILEKKKVLSSRKTEHAHTYSPLISREEYESTSLRHLKNNVFQGDPSSMVMKLLSESSLTQVDLQAIKKFLEERMDS